MAEPVEFTTEPLQEPLASCDAAISCLVRLSVWNGGDARTEAGRSSIDLSGETIPLSQLVTLAAEFGLEAAWLQLDWQGLNTAVSAHPVLIIRDNTEVVLVTAGGRSGAEEVSVWEPQHDGVVFFVSREDFERTWSGHALLISPKEAGTNVFDISPTPSERQRPPKESWVILRLSLGVAATALVGSLGMVLFLLTPPNAGQAVDHQGEIAPSAVRAATAPVLPAPEAASISATPDSARPAAKLNPGDARLGGPKREVSPATQSHL